MSAAKNHLVEWFCLWSIGAVIIILTTLVVIANAVIVMAIAVIVMATANVHFWVCTHHSALEPEKLQMCSHDKVNKAKPK